MRHTLVVLVLLVSCVTNTIMVNGRITFCETCCDRRTNTCNTFCWGG